MRHEVFGELKYERDEGAWSGALRLPRIVAFGRRTETGNEPSVEEMIADIGEGLTHVLNRGGRGVRSPADVLARLPNG